MNQNAQNKFDEQLIFHETINQDYYKEYKTEINSMIEKKLKGAAKKAFIILTVYGAAVTVFLLAYLLTNQTLSAEKSIGMVIGSIIGLFFAVFGGIVLKKGKINMRSNLNVFSLFLGCLWYIVSFYIVFLIVKNPVSHFTVIGALTVVITLVIITAVILSIRIYQSELKIRQNLLKIHYDISKESNA
ncbi:hypothetical protein ACFL5P_02510 [candidate division KSB1 bacterium]